MVQQSIPRHLQSVSDQYEPKISAVLYIYTLPFRSIVSRFRGLFSIMKGGREKMMLHHFEAETHGFQGLVGQNDRGKA